MSTQGTLQGESHQASIDILERQLDVLDAKIDAATNILQRAGLYAQRAWVRHLLHNTLIPPARVTLI